MKKRGLSQEGLKLIACLTMLIDHLGATLILRYLNTLTDYSQGQLWMFVYYSMRIIGRQAFPIFCFLLVEGAHHTRNPKKYGIRLAIGAALSEIPFRLTFGHDGCSVMVTLLLGIGMLLLMQKSEGIWKAVWILPFYLVAEWLHTDYAGEGILIIAVLALTRGHKYEPWLRLACFGFHLLNPTKWNIGYNIMFPVTQSAAFAIIPILCYGGHKLTHNKAVQWAFYLFYPVHIAVLGLLNMWIFG